MSASVVRSVIDFLARKNVTNYSQQWLTACTEWAVDDLQLRGVQSTAENVGNEVLEQWLNTDLKESCKDGGCLGGVPVDSVASVKIQGSYCLQINEIDDMSQSAYAALQEMMGTVNENARVGVGDDVDETFFTQLFGEFTSQARGARTSNRNTRLIMLLLTDGVKEVKAMEKQYVDELKIDLPVGTKVVIRGPLELRRGTFLLTRGTIQFLGGQHDVDQEESALKTLEDRLRDSVAYLSRGRRGEGGVIYRKVNPVSARSTNRTRRTTQGSTSTSTSSSSGTVSVQSSRSVSVTQSTNTFGQAPRQPLQPTSFNRPPAQPPTSNMDIFDDDIDEASLIAAADAVEQGFVAVPPVAPPAAPIPMDDFFDDDFLVAAVEEAERNLIADLRTDSPPSSEPPASKRQRQEEVLVSIPEVEGADYDRLGSVSVRGFVEGMKMEIAESPDKSPGARQFFLTLPVVLSDGQNLARVFIGTTILENICEVSAERIVELLSAKDSRTKEMIIKLRRSVRNDLCGEFTLKKMPGSAGGGDKVVIVSYKDVGDQTLSDRLKARRDEQKREMRT